MPKTDPMPRFTAYLHRKGLSPATIACYRKRVKSFLDWYGPGPESCRKQDVLDYLGHLKNDRHLQAISRWYLLATLRRYFDCLLEGQRIATNPAAAIKLQGAKRRRLHRLYDPAQLAALADAYYQLEVRRAEEQLERSPAPQVGLCQRSYLAKRRDHAVLLFFIHQGLHTREVLRLKITDIDLQQATATIARGATWGNERTLPLHATQVGALMRYLDRIRPRLANPTTDQALFLPVCPVHATAQKKVQASFASLSRQLKRVDPHYTCFRQLRASVITHWVQAYGLRKAQYLAGYRSITSAEDHLPNAVEDLSEDLQKFNPF